MNSEKAKTVVGIDLGTQSLKVIFYDFTKREIVANESAKLALHQAGDGTAEQQAGWWLDALHEALGRIDPHVRSTALALGVSGQQHGFVAVNRDGQVLAPVKLWCDTSTVQECDEIMQELGGPQQCISGVGNPIAAGFTASKIRWLAKHHPAKYEQLDRIMLPHDYLNFHLTGEHAMEAGDASGTGFLNIRNRSWSQDVLNAIDDQRDLSECLPNVCTEAGIIGNLQSEVADRLGLPVGIPVSSGGGDNMMGAIGTGNVSTGKVTMSLGTSGTVYAYSDEPVIDPEGEIAAFCSSNGGWLPLMCTMNCTVSTELMRGLLDDDLQRFEARVSSAKPACDGVITVPFFNGERTPNLPHAKAAIVGLDSQNSCPENLLRSAVEGATFALRYGLERMQELGIESSEIILTGGGMRSASWRQVVADVCQAPVAVLDRDEGASFGAALQALSVIEQAEGTELQQLVDEHLSHDDALSCEPLAESVDIYNEAYQSYQDAVGAISQLYPG